MTKWSQSWLTKEDDNKNSIGTWCKQSTSTTAELTTRLKIVRSKPLSRPLLIRDLKKILTQWQCVRVYSRR